MNRCTCCDRAGDRCPIKDFVMPPDAVIVKNPSPDSCLIIRQGDVCTKFVKPGVDMGYVRRACEMSKQHPDVFVPTEIDGRKLTREFVFGRHATLDELKQVIAVLRAKGLTTVFDVHRNNVIIRDDGVARIIDFMVVRPRNERRVRDQSSKTGR